MTQRKIPDELIPHIPADPYTFVGYVVKHCAPKSKLKAVFALLFQILFTTCDLMVAWALGRITGAISAGGPDIWENTLKQIGILAVIWLVRNAALRTREFLDRRYIPELLNMTRVLLLSRLRRQSQSFLHSNFAGVLANHVRRASEVVNALWEQVMHSIVPLATQFIGASILLGGITPWLAVFLWSFVALGLYTSWLRAPIWTKLSENRAEAMSSLTGYIIDSTTNLTNVQQNTGWVEETRRLGLAHDRSDAAYRKQSFYASVFWGGFDLVTTFFICGFMALLAYGFQAGSVTIAQLTMGTALVMQLFGSIAATVRLLNTQFDEVGTLRDALTKISTPLAVIDAPHAQPLHVEKGRIEFKNVSFAYPEGRPLFEKLNLTIEPGQRVGLVGVSGSGKTTFCQLLLRAYDVQSGGVLIDGQDVKDVRLDSLRANIAIIPQDPALFHRTLAENIGYGKQGASQEDIERAAMAAQASEFIDALPKKYETFVGERGVKLSGGQRQRIAIARAIIKNAPILIFDEATSALDSETEKDIQIAMLEAMRGRTAVVIAHRLSTLAHLDRIVVMEKGEIIEDGTFSALKNAGGTFAKLWNLQAGGFLPDDYQQSQTWPIG